MHEDRVGVRMSDSRFWHVTLTLGGAPCPPADLRAALERLVAERPFMLAVRYAEDCVEMSYLEEARACEDACALALRVWGEHRHTAHLPHWEVRGVEVIDNDARERRRSRDDLRDATIEEFRRLRALRPH